MYCSKCGCQVSDDINFCPKCGAAILKTGQIQGNVDTAPTITEKVTSSPAEETKSPEDSENDNNKPEKFEQVKNEQEKSDSIGIVYSPEVSFDQDSRSVFHYVLAALALVSLAFQGICLWFLPLLRGSVDLKLIKYDGDPVSLNEFLSKLGVWKIKSDVKMIIPGIMCAIMVAVGLFALAELTGSSKKRISYTRNIKDCWTALVIGSVGMVIAYVSVLLWAIPELVKDIFVFEQLFYISLIVSMVTLLISMVMLIVFGVLGKKFKNTDDYKRYLKSAEIFNENAIKKNAFHPYSKKNWVIALICALILIALILIAPLSLVFTVRGSTLVLASPLLILALIYFMVCYRRCYCTEKPFLKKRLQAWTIMVIIFGVSIVMLLLGLRGIGAIVSVFPILGGVFSIIEIAIIRKYLKRGY